MEGMRLIVRLSPAETAEVREKTTQGGYRSMSDTVRAAIAEFEPKRMSASRERGTNVCQFSGPAELTVSYDE